VAKDDDDDSPGRKDTPKAVRSPEEIARAIRALTPVQHRRLSKVAHIYGGTHIEPRDLLQKAFHLALEDGSSRDQGRRCCPTDVDVVTFLCQVMRSVSDGERDKQRTRGVHVVINPRGQAAVDPIDPGPDDPDQSTDTDATYRRILSLFDRDPLARTILEGIAMGADAKELRRRTGLSDIAYQSKRRQIRRIIGKAYPRGLQS
jgi:hypothetical protein